MNGFSSESEGQPIHAEQPSWHGGHGTLVPTYTVYTCGWLNEHLYTLVGLAAIRMGVKLCMYVRTINVHKLHESHIGICALRACSAHVGGITQTITR